jgi:hypothetical protein
MKSSQAISYMNKKLAYDVSETICVSMLKGWCQHLMSLLITETSYINSIFTWFVAREHFPVYRCRESYNYVKAHRVVRRRGSHIF